MRGFIFGNKWLNQSPHRIRFGIFSRKHILISKRYNHTNVWRQPRSVQASIQIGHEELFIKSGKLARFADGCATVQYGDTCVMVTAVSSRQPPSSNQNFMPLTVDYRQKSAAVGRIPTNYLRRELGPTLVEILTSRMIDRSIRPMFPAGYMNDTQLMTNLLSVDSANDPDILAINAASAALSLSDIPWNGPVGAVRVGYVANKIVINPTRKQLQKSLINLIISGVRGEKIAMLEASAENLSDDVFRECLRQGVKETERIVEAISDLQQCEGNPKRPVHTVKPNEELISAIRGLTEDRIKAIYTDHSHHKISRDTAIFAIRDEVATALLNENPDIHRHEISREYNNITKAIFRDLIFEDNLRCDGRKLTDLRDIACEVNLYKPLHGSALFQRGQTQVLCTLAFDSPDSAMKIDTMSSLTSGTKDKNFFLHYEFPPYATNETGRMGVGRREQGHGALAEKSLRPVIPSDCPFTIRLSAEVLESNGSSSMASACAGTLALMDAGVKISQPVAGIAIGAVTRTDEQTNITDHRILTDLLGIEDYMGDMDFKLAGTSTGVTALQADIKPVGLPLSIILEAFDRGLEGKKEILGIMSKTISEPRFSYQANSPVVEEIKLLPEQIPRFIGAGGVNLKKLRADTGVSVTSLGEGKYSIFAPNKEAYKEGKDIIDALTSQDSEKQLDFGGIYAAEITEIREYGVLVRFYPNMRPALVHNKQLDSRKIQHPSALGLEVGQKINVKYLGRDPVDGSMRISRKVLTQAVVPRVTDMLNSIS